MTAARECTKCGLTKSAESFNLDRRAKSGLSSRCKACVAQDRADRRPMDRAYREANRERINQRVMERRRELGEQYRSKANAEARERYAKDKPKYVAKASGYRARSRDAIRERNRQRLAHQRSSLDDLYVAKALGFSSTKGLPADLLNMKRQQLQIHRLSRHVKKGLKNESI